MSQEPPHSVEPPANSPGAILRRCREYHNISIEEAAEATKVGIDHLLALENDRLSEFANLAYLKGFLRIYATHLGLNPDDLVRLYEKRYASPDGAEDDDPRPGTASVRVPRRRRITLRRLALPATLLLLLLITSALLNRIQTPRRPAVPQPPIAAVQVPAIQPVRSTTRVAPQQPQRQETAQPEKERREEQQAGPEKARSTTATEAERPFLLRMRVVHNGELAVSIDGGPPQNYDLAPGDVIEWKAERSMTLELSNGGGVEAELNGKQLKSFGPSGRPAYVVLDAEGIKP